MSQKKSILRCTGSKAAGAAEWPDTFTTTVGSDASSVKSIEVSKAQCTQCHGAGTIKLFISDTECDRCLGAGYYWEGFE